MGTSRRTALVTGAAGVIGRAVAAELADEHVIGTVNAGSGWMELPEVDEVLAVDLTLPRLGLSDLAWHELAERVDVVVHSAALTEWGQQMRRYQAVNVEGTARVVELAARAAASIHLVSTCMVHAIEVGATLSEDNVVGNYCASKLESERLVVRSGLPYSISRPTSLVGDSSTGASARPQIVQRMADWFCRGKAPYFPAHRGNRMDLVPLDTTAAAVAHAVRSDDFGAVYWLTSGHEAMTIAEVQGILVEHAREYGGDITPVPIVSPDDPPPVPLEQVPPLSRRYLQILADLSEVTNTWGGVLPTSLPELRDAGVPEVSVRDAMRLSLKYWAEQRAADAPTTATPEPGS